MSEHQFGTGDYQAVSAGRSSAAGGWPPTVGRRPGRSRRRWQAGRKQPVAQLGEAEQPHEEPDPADPATTHDHPLAHDPAGQELEPVPVHQQVTVALHDHGRLQGADNPVAVLHLQGKASSWLEGAGDLGQDLAVAGVVEVAEGGEPADDPVEAAGPGQRARPPGRTRLRRRGRWRRGRPGRETAGWRPGRSPGSRGRPAGWRCARGRRPGPGPPCRVAAPAADTAARCRRRCARRPAPRRRSGGSPRRTVPDVEARLVHTVPSSPPSSLR